MPVAAQSEDQKYEKEKIMDDLAIITSLGYDLSVHGFD